MVRAPPPSGISHHTVLDSESDRAYCMFREGLRTWAPGWVTTFYFFSWAGLCGLRALHKLIGLGITPHQQPGRGRNAQLRDMMAWLDYVWYHERGVCWATDTVGLHVAAAIIAPVDACLVACRHAHGIGLEWYASGYWWLFWR